MNATYDHLVAVVLVGVIFIGTVVAMPAAMSFNTFEAVDQQQLRNTTLNVFNAMLLGTGNPSNWGSQYPFNPTNVNAFGLSSSASFSTFILDPDKVQRIDEKSSGYINYTQTLKLLNLQGYGFQFSLYRPFKVDTSIEWSDLTTDNVLIDVNVTRTEDSTPIPNAVVKANFIGVAANLQNVSITKVLPSNVTYISNTDLLGRATISGTLTIDSGYTLDQAFAVIHITVAGMDTMVMASRQGRANDVLKIDTFGDNVTLMFNRDAFYGNYSASEKGNEGSRWVKSIYGYDLEALVSLWSGNAHLNAGQGETPYESWSQVFPGLSSVNPSMLILVMEFPLPKEIAQEFGYKNGGNNKPIVIAGPFGFTSSNKIFQFGSENPTGKVLSTMRRFVLISGMTYVAELILWKE